jgi:hypothetical protein
MTGNPIGPPAEIIGKNLGLGTLVRVDDIFLGQGV